MCYHEHDSLLDHKEEEALSEEDRKAAWAEYEAEKKVRKEAKRKQDTHTHTHLLHFDISTTSKIKDTYTALSTCVRHSLNH